jgi:TetR/AcrR family transcriptional repressor of nem operon
MMIIMRYPEGHKEEVKERIVRAAARAFRRHGLGSVSIPVLMKRVGLTHGGFYTHFKNRADLVAQAIHWAGNETGSAVFSEKIPLRETLERYLSKAHLEHPETGCILAALGTDGARQPARVRQAFAEVARGFLRLTAGKTDRPASGESPSDAALVRAATMVGAVVLARLVHDEALAERILSACRAVTS